jgi:UDP-N-acetylmuramoyl-tripeptide--D-alanyl-D-alanine ligase
MNFFIILTFIFWSIVVFKNIFFWIYFWQTKEYRADRMRAHFQLPTGKNLLFNKRNAWIGVLFLASLIPLGAVQILTAAAAIFFYLFFTIRAAQQLQAKAIRLPKITLRTLLILSLCILTYIGISAFVFLVLNRLVLSWFLLSDLLVPAFVTLMVLTTSPISKYAKYIKIKQAQRKIEKLKDLLVIGITGSYGKSSMKEILSAILAKNFRVLKTPANINTDIGAANLILKKLQPNHEIFIVEMGAYRRDDVKKIAEMTHPQIGILTGINLQHVSLFGSMQNIQEAKYELIEALPDSGLAVFNGDSENAMALFRQCKKVKRLYSLNESKNKEHQKIFVKKIENTKNGLEIIIKENGKKSVVLKTQLRGQHNALNILGAIVVAREIGVKYPKIIKAVEKLKPPAHTLQIKKGIKESTVIDDSYSANEDGVLAALQVIKNLPGAKKICVLQPLIELGDSAERVHKSIATGIADSCDYAVLTGKDYFNIIYKEALDGGMSKDAVFCLPNPVEALRKIQEITGHGDIILLENRVPEIVLKGVILNT